MFSDDPQKEHPIRHANLELGQCCADLALQILGKTIRSSSDGHDAPSPCMSALGDCTFSVYSRAGGSFALGVQPRVSRERKMKESIERIPGSSALLQQDSLVLRSIFRTIENEITTPYYSTIRMLES